MQYLSDSRTVVIAQGQAITNAGTLTTGLIDTLGADYVSIDVVTTTSNNATNIPTVLKLQECDTTVATSFVDIVPATGGTAVDATHGFVIPPAATATATTGYVRIDVDCRARKRYLRLLISPVTTQTFDVHARLGRLEQSARDATGVGMAGAYVAI